MFKALQNKDEIEESSKIENNTLNKVDKKIEKEINENAYLIVDEHAQKHRNNKSVLLQ